MSVGVDNILDFPELAKLPKPARKEIAEAVRLLSLQIRLDERDRAAGIVMTSCADSRGLQEAIDLIAGRQ
jgi:hypothetical protein